MKIGIDYLRGVLVMGRHCIGMGWARRETVIRGWETCEDCYRSKIYKVNSRYSHKYI